MYITGRCRTEYDVRASYADDIAMKEFSFIWKWEVLHHYTSYEHWKPTNGRSS